MGMDPPGQHVNDTGTAGVIARPGPLLIAALLLGLASDRLLPRPFAVPGTDPVRRMTGGSVILVGVALEVPPKRSVKRPGEKPDPKPSLSVVTIPRPRGVNDCRSSLRQLRLTPSRRYGLPSYS